MQLAERRGNHEVRRAFGFGASDPDAVAFSVSIAFVFIEFLLAAFCGRHMDHSGSEKLQAES